MEIPARMWLRRISKRAVFLLLPIILAVGPSRHEEPGHSLRHHPMFRWTVPPRSWLPHQGWRSNLGEVEPTGRQPYPGDRPAGHDLCADFILRPYEISQEHGWRNNLECGGDQRADKPYLCAGVRPAKSESPLRRRCRRGV
jgi:hypothetical protein